MTINYELLLWYYVYLLETAWITLQCTLFCLSVRSDKHSAGDRLFVLWPLTPAHCHGWGGGYLSFGAYWTPWKSSHPASCSEQSALRLNQSRCFSVTQRTELRLFFFLALEQRSRHQHRTARTVWPAGGSSSSSSRSQPTCLYYNVLTKSPVSHHPFLYSNGETLLVYEFDICTNAPLWKRKWNLDISGINVWLVSSFLFTNKH